NIPMERTQALAVPCPAHAPGPCAAEGPGHQANPLEMRATDVAELRGSAAGFHAVRRPHARLRHGRSLRLASEALPTKRAYGRSDCHFCPQSPSATLLRLAAGSNLSLAKDRDRYVDVEGRPSGRFTGRTCAWP